MSFEYLPNKNAKAEVHIGPTDKHSVKRCPHTASIVLKDNTLILGPIYRCIVNVIIFLKQKNGSAVSAIDIKTTQWCEVSEGVQADSSHESSFFLADICLLRRVTKCAQLKKKHSSLGSVLYPRMQSLQRVKLSTTLTLSLPLTVAVIDKGSTSRKYVCCTPKLNFAETETHLEFIALAKKN